MHGCAPVLFLIFNRPETTARVFEAIARAQPRQLFVAADGPRETEDDEAKLCAEVRDIATKVTWECELKVLFRDQNLGCKEAVQSAISWFFDHVEAGIILEDDCLPSSSFFRFCSAMLDRYSDDQRVLMVSGNNFQPAGESVRNASYYFSRIYHIWGWATWRRAWKYYDPDMQELNPALVDDVLDTIFPDENLALTWRLTFASARSGRVNTWDYPWVYSCFLQGGLSIVPALNLVTNIGFGSGTHTTTKGAYFEEMARGELDEIVAPKGVYCDMLRDLQEYRASGVYPLIPGMSLSYRYQRWRRRKRLSRKLLRIASKLS